jgi:hypothetical protein
MVPIVGLQERIGGQHIEQAAQTAGQRQLPGGRLVLLSDMVDNSLSAFQCGKQRF